MIYSENIGLKIPQSTDYFTTSDFAENYVIIDNEIHELNLAILDLENDIEDVVDNSAPPIIATAQGENITVSDSAERKLKGLSIFGKSAQDGTPTSDAPIEITSTSDSGSVTVTVSDGGENSQTLTIPTSSGLYGIPVTSGGNYIDENGQQWICDEIDFARGVLIKNTKQVVVDGTNVKLTLMSTIDNNGTPVLQVRLPYNDSLPKNALCSHLTYDYRLWASAPFEHFLISSNPGYFRAFFEGYEDIDSLNASFADNPMTVVYILATPVEIPLTDEQKAEYSALMSYFPTTTATNDKGAGLKLSYIADTKTYIDNKFAELSAAVL